MIEGQRQSVLEDGDALQALHRQAAHRVRAAPAATSFTIQAIFSVLFSSVYRNNVVLPASSDGFDEGAARSAQIPPQVNLLTCTQEPRQHGNLGLHVRHGGDPNSIDTGHARRDAGTFHKGGIHRESTHGSGTECVIVPRCLGKSSSATRACPSRSSERPVISAYLFFCRPSAIASMASIPSASGQNLQTLGFIGHQEQE